MYILDSDQTYTWLPPGAGHLTTLRGSSGCARQGSPSCRSTSGGAARPCACPWPHACQQVGNFARKLRKLFGWWTIYRSPILAGKKTKWILKICDRAILENGAYICHNCSEQKGHLSKYWEANIKTQTCREVQKALQRAREDLSSNRGQLLKLTAATFPSTESIAYIDNASSV